MGQTETTRQSDEILPPIAGSTLALSVTTSVLVVDLTTWPQSAALPASTVKGSEHTNPLGQYIELVADTYPAYVLFAPTYAKAAAISASATTTVASTTGVMTVTGTEAYLLAAGIPYHFRLPPGPTSSSSGTGGAWGANSSARYMGLIVSATSTTVRGCVGSR